MGPSELRPGEVKDVEADQFSERLRDLSGQTIVSIATTIRHEMESVDGEVTWWRAT